jgi:hypothetical protein
VRRNGPARVWRIDGVPRTLPGVDEARILAVTPPGSMERALYDLRGELYRLWGAVSALALPPLVPLRRWPLRLERAEAAAVLASVAAPLELRIECYQRVGGWLTFALARPGLDELGERFDAALGRFPPGEREAGGVELFPIASALLLAGPDLEASVEEVACALPLPEEARSRSYGLSVLVVRSGAPRERWWDCSSWEEEAHVPVKSSGRASPGSGAKLPVPRASGEAPPLPRPGGRS